MIRIRPRNERGHFNHGWLDTYHTFSFGQYFDPEHHQFRALRVINEDRVAAGQGFGTHPHRDMEIVTYVLEGTLAHRDSLGNGDVLRPGDVQVMTAGSGITHSEFNGSDSQPAHFLQIWVLPEAKGLAPAYAQQHFTDEDLSGQLRLIATNEPSGGALKINQDARVYAARLAAGQTLTLPLAEGRHGWVQVARGDVTLSGEAAPAVGANAHPAVGSVAGQSGGATLAAVAPAAVALGAGDGAALSEEAAIVLTARTAAEVLVFDLA